MPRKKKLPRHVRRHGVGFRAVVAVDGKRHRSPVLDTAEQASQWAESFLGIARQHGTAPLNLSLADGLDLIRNDLAATGGRKATVSSYENHARILFAGLGGAQRDLRTIEKRDVESYIAARRRKGIAPQTITGKELFILGRIIKLAKAAGYVLPRDPFDGVRMPKGRATRFDVLTKDRIMELVEKMRAHKARKGKWHADLVELLFATGLRRAELERLRVADIDLDAMRLRIDGKTDNRYQPFGETLVPVLRRLIAAAKPDGRLFTSFRTIEKLFERWQQRLGEPRFTTHTVRHSYATDLADKVGPFELMALMGHSSLKQTSRYFHGRGDAVRAALRSLLPDRQTTEQCEGDSSD